jgi:hypothetical protein
MKINSSTSISRSNAAIFRQPVPRISPPFRRAAAFLHRAKIENRIPGHASWMLSRHARLQAKSITPGSRARHRSEGNV